jgi:hypothetical protein
MNIRDSDEFFFVAENVQNQILNAIEHSEEIFAV